MNFQSTTGNGPIIKQLYFRQALAYLMNQKSVIQGPLRGYGQFTVGPVPNYAEDAVPLAERHAPGRTRSRSASRRPRPC